MRRRGYAAIVGTGLLLAACARQPQQQPLAPAPDMPIDFPAPLYAQMAAAGGKIYRIDPTQSLAVITVRRGGTLARLGHDHVVASHDLGGFVALDAGQADLYMPLNLLSVDEALLRTEAALDTQPLAADIAGTRQNMLEKVLETARYPWARLHVSAADLGQEPTRLTVTISLHGVTRELEIPATVVVTPRQLSLSGHFELNQSAFGIAPFSVLGGALQVQDQIALRFEITARRL